MLARLSYVFLASLLGAVGVHAQVSLPGDPNPAQSYNHLEHVDYGSPSFAVAVGNVILRSRNGGISWEQLSKPTGQTLRAVAFVSEFDGYVVGDGGVIFRTIDGSDTWTAQTSGVTSDLNGVSFPHALRGTAVGDNGVILRTEDGGNTWMLQASGTTANLVDVDFITPSVGMVAGHGKCPVTFDGGATWGEFAPTDADCVDMLGFDTIYLGSGPKVWRSNDGGTSWTVQLDRGTCSGPSATCYTWFDIAFPSLSTGVAVGLAANEAERAAYSARTTDGGNSWDVRYQQDSTIHGMRANGVAFGDVTTGSMVGVYDFARYTLDGGENWYPPLLPADSPPWSPPPLFSNVTASRLTGQVQMTWNTDSTERTVGYRIRRDVGFGAVTWYPPDRLIDPVATSHVIEGAPASTQWPYTVVAYLSHGETASSEAVVEGPPSYPEIISFDATAGLWQVDLQWEVTGGTGVAGFRLVRNHETIPDVGLLDPAIRSYRDRDVSHGTQYDYTLHAIHHWNGEVISPQITVKTLDGAVATVRADPGIESVDLEWEMDHTMGIIDFYIERYIEPEGSFVVVADSLEPSTRSYRDDAVTHSTTYRYYVATRMDRLTNYSDPVTVTTLAYPAVTVFSVDPGVQHANLSWEVDSAEAIVGFRVRRSDEDGNEIWLPGQGAFPPAARSAMDEAVEPDSHYEYTLFIDLENGASVQSEPLAIKSNNAPTLPAFQAVPADGHVAVSWEISASQDFLGFRLLRQDVDGGDDNWLPPLGQLPGDARSYDDTSADPGTGYLYTLVAYLDPVGEFRSEPTTATPPDVVPNAFTLGQNQPNPFNPATRIPYALTDDADVVLVIYDASGRRVRTLVREFQTAGFQTAEWDGRDDAGTPVGSGVYFYRLHAGGFEATRKMVLVR